ncbi:MAG: SH3 domain-containing protein, partial [Anaerolineae bacterium]|nr:SH3 domain-containing protein [Anaerolineae bacterium]
RKAQVVYNWSCYTYSEGVVIAPPTATPDLLGRAIGTLTPKQNVEVNVRSGPGVTYNQIGRIDWQQTFPLLEVQGEWYVINYNGQRGYISARWADIKLQ